MILEMAYPKDKPREPTNLRMPHSEETRKKISESCKKAKMGHWNKGPKHSEEWTQKIAEKLSNLCKSA